jgi:hypothetical protein
VNWQDRAACRNAVTDGVVTSAEHDPWFPRGDADLAAQALTYCATCPVTFECKAEADGLRKKYGAWAEATKMQSVWGGQLRGVVERDTPARGPDTADSPRMKAYAAGKTDREMAEEAGVTTNAIRHWRIARKLPAHMSPLHSYHHATERRREWHSWGWTDQQMADSDGVSVATIQRWRDRWRLPRNHERGLNMRAG